MKKNAIVIAVIVLLIGSMYYFVTLNSKNEVGEMMTYEDTTPENPSMGDGMDHSGMDHAAVDTERGFLEHMIPHHEEAIKSSEALLANGTENAALKTLAQNIIDTQTKEVADMRRWYQEWYGKAYEETPYTPMMRDMTSLSGTERDAAFLEDMIAHHAAALEQGQRFVSQSSRPEILQLATTIAETQSNEIIEMRMMQAQLAQ